MNIQEAKAKIGATHFKAMKDGKTPQLFFRFNKCNFLEYYSSFGIWCGSLTNGDKNKFNALKNSLIEIK